MTGHQTDEEEGGVREDTRFYIEASSSSECELGSRQHHQPHVPSPPPPQREACATRGGSPLVLAFTLSGRALSDDSSRDGTPSPKSRSGLRSQLDQAQESVDEPLEEWMFLGGEEQVGDREIQLNLGYWSSSSSEFQSGTEDEELNANSSVKDPWAIIDKDQPRPHPDFTSDLGLTCHTCNKSGHLAKSCTTTRRRPSCVLCGLQGHVQRGCPGQHCPSCGLPSHGQQSCSAPPLWNQHCQRCGMTGHLSAACPDEWRQFHHTTQGEVPLKPDHGHTHRRLAHCYNCSGTGHHGHECPQRRMVSGTFLTLPYVCHYNNKQDILKHREPQQGVKLVLEHQRTYVTAGGSCKKEPPTVPERRKSQDGRREGRKKKWPEKRRERRELKKQRRDAQARREVGMITPASEEVY